MVLLDLKYLERGRQSIMHETRSHQSDGVIATWKLSNYSREFSCIGPNEIIAFRE